jgi:protein-S-isoprenylcysteine O-methyltransferase Ste14
VENAPKTKRLQLISFITQVARGAIRDQKMRRKAMLGSLLVALILLVAGSTILQPLLNPHEHPGWFIVFWFVCAWITILAMLLALFDLLMLRLQKRTAEKLLHEQLPRTQTPDSPPSQDGE